MPAPVGMGATGAGIGHSRDKRAVFVLPEWVTKNKEARVVVLNDVAEVS
jgi:hypothetical protein